VKNEPPPAAICPTARPFPSIGRQTSLIGQKKAIKQATGRSVSDRIRFDDKEEDREGRAQVDGQEPSTATQRLEEALSSRLLLQEGDVATEALVGTQKLAMRTKDR
jgi:hypothetical protein